MPTETTTLEALLRRWAAKDPERCRFHEGSYMYWYDGDWAWDDNPNQKCVLQAATQEAIEARRWLWELDNCGMVLKHSARVRRFVEDEDAKFWEDNAPSFALLSAYLTALEAQK